MSNTVNPHKAHFEVAHRLFCLIFCNRTKKDKEVEEWINDAALKIEMGEDATGEHQRPENAQLLAE